MVEGEELHAGVNAFCGEFGVAETAWELVRVLVRRMRTRLRMVESNKRGSYRVLCRSRNAEQTPFERPGLRSW